MKTNEIHVILTVLLMFVTWIFTYTIVNARWRQEAVSWGYAEFYKAPSSSFAANWRWKDSKLGRSNNSKNH